MFFQQVKSQLLIVFNQDWQMFGVKLNNMSNFYPLEVVGRGSETQFQVGEFFFF